MTLVFAPKVQQHQAWVFSIAQRQPSTRQLRPLLAVPMGGTILMTSPSRLRACHLRNKEFRRRTPYNLIPLLRVIRASHCTTASASAQKDRAVPDPRPRPPLRARLHAIAERRQRTSSAKRVVFILVEAWQTNTGWLAPRAMPIPLMRGRGGSSSRRWSRRRTKTRMRIHPPSTNIGRQTPWLQCN